jgi:hypothetical protein
MKIGRNDPCPCGSGKKYKKCCLGKETVKETLDPKSDSDVDSKFDREDSVCQPPTSEVDTRVTKSPDSKINSRKQIKTRTEACWDKFEAAPHEARVDLFLKTLDDEELMDDEMASEMLDSIRDEMVKRGELVRFDQLLDALQERLPKVYTADSNHYLSYRISNALAERRFEHLESIRNLSQDLADAAIKDIDVYNRIADALAYHGRMKVLLNGIRLAWPRIEKSEDILSNGIDEYAQTGTLYEVFEYIEENPEGVINRELRSRVKYFGASLKWIKVIMPFLVGQKHRTWELKDFQLTKSRKSDTEESTDFDDNDESEASTGQDTERDRLVQLSYLFLGWAHRERGVNYSKAEMGRENIVYYFLERFDGGLVERPSMYDAAIHGKKPGKRKPIEHPLCPDRETFDRFLSRMVDFVFMGFRYYEAAATFEMMILWLSFLEPLGLISEQKLKSVLEELAPLRGDLSKLLKEVIKDPVLTDNF